MGNESVGARVRVEGRRLRLSPGVEGASERDVPLLSGSLQYYRMERAAWRPALEGLAAMSLPIVELYVPWGVHEEAPGRFDFGDRDPKKDLGALLDLVHETGLLAFVRPGPHINAEMTWFGLPERIVHDRGCQARSPRQNPVVLMFPPLMFPVPSYASTTYLAEVGRWYDAVAAVVAPRLWPNGPVALAQVDNEAAFYFRNGPYCQDYHPDAVARWRDMLRAQYESLDEVAAAHRRRYLSWEDVRPPLAFDAKDAPDLAIHLDWARFHEHLLSTSVTWMRERLEQAGVRGIPMAHNVPLGERGLPVSLPDLEQRFDLVGLDFYHSRREHLHVRRRALYMAGTLRFPYAPELGVGAPFWFTPLAHEDSLHTALVALAYGLRGFNLYMAVERDRWYGAPIDVEGRRRAGSGVWKSLLDTLVATRFDELERKAAVGLVLPREHAQLARVTHLFGAASPSTFDALGIGADAVCREDTFGFAEPIQIASTEHIDRLALALDAVDVPYVFVDGDAPVEQLARCRVLVCPSFEVASPERWERLAEAARRGSRVFLSPRVPTLDVSIRPKVFAPIPGSEVVSLATRAEAEALAARLAHDAALRAPATIRALTDVDDRLEVTVHQQRATGADGAELAAIRVVFCMNPTSRKARARVTFVEGATAPERLADALTGEAFDVVEGSFEVALPASSARMLVVERPSAEIGLTSSGDVAGAPSKSQRPRARARKAGSSRTPEGGES
ncbi:MAG: beta-galactosidase [Deltaproteobacteria bacterium]|nr:beta-galactosidase [Deltaproteobacteria bacterium]